MKLHSRLAVGLTAAALVFSGVSFSFSAAGKDEDYTLIPVGNHEPYTVVLDYETPDALLAEMREVAANDAYRLYVHERSLVVAIQNRTTDELTFTNPSNAAKDPYYTENIRKGMESQIVVSYAGSDGNVKTLWSSTDCANLGQFEIQTIENGVEITLSIGEEKERRLIPEAVSATRFEEKILGAFPADAEEGVRIRNRLQKVLYKKTSGDAGDVYIVRKLTNREKDEVEGYMQQAGYTFEDMDADHIANKVTVESAYFPNFQMKLRYSLTAQGLQFTIPADSIRFDSKNFHLISIKALEYFGAVSAKDAQDGYILMPDGSGTLVDFQTTDPKRQSLISGQVYGFDGAVTYPDVPRQGRSFLLPVFGMKNGDSGYFAIVSGGAGLTSLSAYAGTHFGEYFTAFPTFSYTTREELLLERKVATHGSSSTAYLYDENVYIGDYTVDYAFLHGDDATYTGMAHYYQRYLMEQGMKKTAGSGLGLSVETIGTLDYTDKFLGIPYNAAAKLTTFDQSREIVEYFRAQGIANVSLSLEAWRAGGRNTTAANRFDPSSALGGKQGFTELAAWCAENNVPFYPNIDLVNVARDKWFDGFNPNRDTIRLMNDKLGGLMTVRPDTSLYDKSTFQYGLSPLKYAAYLRSFQTAYGKTGATSFGLGTLGTYLNSNFSAKQRINRQQNIEQITALLQESAAANALQFRGANAYVLPYATQIANVPMSSSGYKGTTSVPFLQLVLNGVLSYTSEPINAEYDMQRALLSCIESATSPHYLLAQDNIRKIKLTEHTEYYSIGAAHWLDTVAQGYKTVADALAPVADATITAHETLADGVKKITYSNGWAVYVNYTAGDVQADGVLVPAMGSKTVKGGSAA